MSNSSKGIPSLKLRLTTGVTQNNSSQVAHLVTPSPIQQQPFPYTYEEQLVVRFQSPTLAARIREELKENGQPEDFSLKFIDERRAEISSHGQKYPALLLDLPTIIESHKTLDRSQYYKIADICQFLLVLSHDNVEEAVRLTKYYESLDWQFPDGLTPPMKNVRVRRFKNTSSTSIGQLKQMETIENRVQQLLAADEAATSSTFTIFDSTGKAVLTGGDTMDGKYQKVSSTAIIEYSGSEAEPVEQEGDQAYGDGEVEGDYFGGEDQGSEDEAFADEFAAELEEELLAVSDLDDAEGEFIGQQSVGVPTPTPSPAILELRGKIDERKAQLASVTNPVIKARLEEVIKQLEDDLRSRTNNH